MTDQQMADDFYKRSTTLYREDFDTRDEYMDVFRECSKHYDFKVGVRGGWSFYEFVTPRSDGYSEAKA